MLLINSSLKKIRLFWHTISYGIRAE